MVDRRLEVLEEMYARSNDENYELSLSAIYLYCAFRIPDEDKPFYPKK